ncbi:unnamed protein product [Arabis nemorensis]|uniref:Leucine-rich repeat-containing N-terminal plant-type domain-containing protein n=1 Tax=Arabis nemorensis TaxID=586526 RepID=A0A565CIV0_9BRAS|nr:unnamed protein product [Arabis nemorensis]
MRMIKLFNLSLFFILFPRSESCDSNDKTTLLKIKKSLNNPQILSSWDPRNDCCIHWIGVACTHGRITGLTIQAGDVVGQIAEEIGDLTDLVILDWSSLYHLRGTIPRSITKLKNLVYLRFRITELSGPIPEYISELQNITFLDLSFNRFNTRFDFSNAEARRNTARSQISTWIIITSQEKIPKSLSKSDFNIVSLSGNNFSGDASMFFGHNKTSVRLDFVDEQLPFRSLRGEIRQELGVIGPEP